MIICILASKITVYNVIHVFIICHNKTETDMILKII